MELLIQHGADVAATDIDKSNIIHSIVLNEDYKKFMVRNNMCVQLQIK